MGGRTIAVVVAMLAAAPGVARADHPVALEAQSGSAAFAFWSPQGEADVVTEVFVATSDDLLGESYAFVGVFQGWCDGGNDQLVSRVFASDEMPAGSLQPLRSAAIAGDALLHGWELRIPDCSDPSFDSEWTETDLGVFPVRVEASWSGRGSPHPDVGAGVDPQPGCGFAFAGAGAEREADAHGSIAGALPLAGGVDLANLESDVSFAGLLTGSWAAGFTSLDCPDGW